jgi:hypothetical protein
VLVQVLLWDLLLLLVLAPLPVLLLVVYIQVFLH